MKRFLIKIFVFFAIIAVCDFGFGCIFDYMQGNAKGGKTKTLDDLLVNDCHDVVVLGSSRAYRHYDPVILEQTLGCDCYNAGYDGMGIVFDYPVLSTILERCQPRLVIYEVTRNSDLNVNNDDANNRYISMLKPYFRNPKVAEVIRSVSMVSYIKLHSSLYRYNTEFLNIVLDFFKSRNMDYKGYQPYRETFKFIYPTHIDENYDSLKLYWLREFAKLSKVNNVKMVWVLSPQFNLNDEDYCTYRMAKEIAGEYDIPFFDHYYDNNFCEHEEYFKDEIHLNIFGASLFSQIIASELLPLIQ